MKENYLFNRLKSVKLDLWLTKTDSFLRLILYPCALSLNNQPD